MNMHVHTSSIHVWYLPPFPLSDSASKHSVQGYYDALRNEVSPYGIQVSVISPGYIQTNLSRNALQGDGTAHGGRYTYVCMLRYQSTVEPLQ